MNEEQLEFDPTVSEVNGKRYIKITRNSNIKRIIIDGDKMIFIYDWKSDYLLESASREKRIQADPYCQKLMTIP
jgi:hypothetical protein